MYLFLLPPTVLDEHKDLYHPLITYVLLLLTGFAVVCALIAAVLSLVNVAKLYPTWSVQGPIGMCFYNVTGGESLYGNLIFL